MRNENGFSLIELLIVVAIILVIAAIAIPNLIRARMSANEAAAASTVRNINNSQATYLIQFGSAGFAPSLAILGPGAPCDQTHACLVDDLIGCATQPCTKSGYQFYLTASATFPVASYTTTATPIGFSTTGRQNYCSSEDGIIKTQVNATASLGGALTRAQCADPAVFQPFN